MTSETHPALSPEEYDHRWDVMDNQGLDTSQIEAALGPAPYETITIATPALSQTVSRHETGEAPSEEVRRVIDQNFKDTLMSRYGDEGVARAMYMAEHDRSNKNRRPGQPEAVFTSWLELE